MFIPTQDAIQVPILTTSPSRQISKEDIIKVINDVLSYCSPLPPLSTKGSKVTSQGYVQEWWGSLHVQDLRHLVLTRGLLPILQGNCNIWFGASWVSRLDHGPILLRHP